MAARNSARYLAGGKLIEVPGEKLLVSATPSNRFPTMRLEVIPNRDSLEYRGLYGIPNVKSICRGTLRYQGWANVMQSLKVLNLMELTDINNENWAAYLEVQLKKGGINPKNGKTLEHNLMDLLRHEGSVQQPEVAIEALKWLGLWGGSSPVTMQAKTPLDSLCKVMEDRLTFQENERDMVAMFHTIVGRMPDGSVEHHTSRLLDFGEPGRNADSAMSKTVGYTTGAAAELILNGQMGTTGVSIPTSAEVYKPMLRRLQDFGIHWTDKVDVVRPN
jgi:saccharopine dehydrogenase-like NADP-dependent oxidoreductase